MRPFCPSSCLFFSLIDKHFHYIILALIYFHLLLPQLLIPSHPFILPFSSSKHPSHIPLLYSCFPGLPSAHLFIPFHPTFQPLRPQCLPLPLLVFPSPAGRSNSHKKIDSIRSLSQTKGPVRISPLGTHFTAQYRTKS